jgi:hypothetical protein
MIACHRGTGERQGSPRAVERDRGHDSLIGEPGHAELEIEAGFQIAQVRDDLLRDDFRAPT